MHHEPLFIPPIVRNKAIAVGAQHWLDAVPALVAELADEWAFTIEHTFDGGTEAFVAAVVTTATTATTTAGEPAVLKLMVPRDDAAAHEIAVLRLADGDGCVRLLRADAARGALLLERLGTSLFDAALPLEQRLPILTVVAARVWRPAPDAGLPSGAAKGRWLVDHITQQWEALDRPCSEAAVAYALECAERRILAHDDSRAVLVHGDVHQWNTLRSGEGWKLVDPDGLLAEAEYDLGILMREDPQELMVGDPHDRSRLLAALTGRDEVAIWEWGVVERVSTGLVCTAIGLQPFGRQMLDAAHFVAVRRP